MTDQEKGAEGHYRAIFESAVDFAIIASDTEGRITDWNPGAARILGWTATEMIGECAERFFTVEDRAQDRPRTEMRGAVDTGRSSDERWHLRKDGTLFWANSEMMPLRGSDGAHFGFIKILRDRTEQRRAEQAQAADAAFLHSVLASSGDCIKVLDLDATLVFMSEGGQRVMEVSDFNAIRGCPWPDFWQDQGNLQAKAAVAAAKAGGVGQFQGAADTMAGTPKWWDVQVTPILGPGFGPRGHPGPVLAAGLDRGRRQRRARRGGRRASGQNGPVPGILSDAQGHAQVVGCRDLAVAWCERQA